MSKVINRITTLGKSFYGLVIYFAVVFVFKYIVKLIPNIDYLLQNIIIIASDIVTFILLIIVFRKRLKKDFVDFDKNYNKYLKIGIKAWVIGMVVMIISNSVINFLVLNKIAYNQAANIAIMSKFPIYAVISTLILGPFIEEVVFRLSFKNVLTNKKLYYFLSVFIFTSMHVFNGISSPLELLYFIPYGSLAVAFSYTLDKTDNIFTTVVIHSVHNALTVALMSMSGVL